MNTVTDAGPSWDTMRNKMNYYYDKRDGNLSSFKGVTQHFYFDWKYEVDAYKFICHIESLLRRNCYAQCYRILTYKKAKWYCTDKRSGSGMFGYKVTVKASKEDMNLIRLTMS